jgi:RNA polymerase sigma-70 factor (ECF subfamily)
LVTVPHVSPGRNKSPTTSRSLLDQARADDREAWERIYALYLPLVYRWCRNRGLNDGDTSDVVQDVFAAVYAKLGTFEKVRVGQSFRGWLRTITENKVTDHHRRASRQPTVRNCGEFGWDPASPTQDSDHASDLDNEADERVFILQRCLAMVRTEFEPRTWDAFWMVAVEEKSPADVAEQLGMKRNAVYLAKSRVLHRLKQLFDQLIDDVETFQ